MCIRDRTISIFGDANFLIAGCIVI